MRFVIAGLVLVTLLSIFGCARGRDSLTEDQRRSASEVEYLFTIDGCKVYGFAYHGYSRTIGICPSQTTDVAQVGKTTQPYGGSTTVFKPVCNDKSCQSRTHNQSER